MEIIHLHVKIISRKKGKSAIAAAAYRSNEKIRNERNGVVYDFTKKHDVVYKQILLPANAPSAFYDRENLWNAVEKIEKSQNSRTAREVEVSLPIELARTEQIQLIVAFVQENFANHGMCADICVHDKGNGNPHAHVMLTTRSLDENGKWIKKQIKNYIFDKDGKKIYDPIKKQYKCAKSLKFNDWDNMGNVEKWRQEWTKMCNLEFKRKGLEKIITHESYALQDIDKEPTKHLGPELSTLKKRGIHTDRINENLDIMKRNKEREEQKRRREYERTQSIARWH